MLGISSIKHDMEQQIVTNVSVLLNSRYLNKKFTFLKMSKNLKFGTMSLEEIFCIFIVVL
jgi:hypothetical protein